MASGIWIPQFLPNIGTTPWEIHNLARSINVFSKKLTQPISVSAAYTVASEIHWVRVDASGGAVTVTLPPVGELGRPIGIIKTDSSSNAVTVDGNGSETINGATTKTLAAQYDCLEVIDNGSSWDVSFTGNFTSVASLITVADEGADSTCFPLFSTSATGNVQPKTDNGNFQYDSSTGQLQINLISLLGGQLLFPSTQNASANANTLDDYEEGTFTPVIWDDSLSSSESQAYSVQTGKYTKIGNVVFYQLRLETTSLGTLTTTQQVKIGGLPFTCGASFGGMYATTGAALALATAGFSVNGRIPAGQSYIDLFLWDATAGQTVMLLSEWSADGHVIAAGHYYIS